MQHAHAPGRRLRSCAALIAAVTGIALLAGCGSSSSSSGSAPAAAAGGTSRTAASSTKAVAADYPTQDVISAIAEDSALHAELAAAVPGVGSTLTLGTTLQPGLNGLPHAGTSSSGENVGADVDLRNAVAKLLGITWDVQNGTFATIIPGVQNGKYQVGQDNFAVTAAREKVVGFATYLTDGQALLVPSSSTLPAAAKITDLCGLTVGTGAGSSFQQILTTHAGDCAKAGKQPYTVQYFADNSAIWLGLANGRIDVYFGPTLSLKYDATHVPNVKFLDQLSSTPVGFVTAKDSALAKVLADAVNKLIASGDYAKILAKWSIADYGVPASQVNPAPSL
jgi:polar amino acid transport system substrate-binding protein